MNDRDIERLRARQALERKAGIVTAAILAAITLAAMAGVYIINGKVT